MCPAIAGIRRIRTIRAFYWQQLLDDGVVASGSKIAKREGLHSSTVNELLRLTLLEPAIIQAILAGQQPRCMLLLWFQRNPLPTDWVAGVGGAGGNRPCRPRFCLQAKAVLPAPGMKQFMPAVRSDPGVRTGRGLDSLVQPQAKAKGP
jgi:hypothetical protein